MLEGSGELNDRLGPMHRRITPGGPMVFISTTNKTSNPTEYEAAKINGQLCRLETV